MKEVENALADCQKSIVEIRDDKSYGKAAYDWAIAKGIVTGIYCVVNNLEDCSSNEVLQDMLDNWECELHKTHELLQIMKPAYWGK